MSRVVTKVDYIRRCINLSRVHYSKEATMPPWVRRTRFFHMYVQYACIYVCVCLHVGMYVCTVCMNVCMYVCSCQVGTQEFIAKISTIVATASCRHEPSADTDMNQESEHMQCYSQISAVPPTGFHHIPRVRIKVQLTPTWHIPPNPRVLA